MSKTKAVAASVGLAVVLFAIAVGLWVLGVWMVVWNVNDMMNVGVNFWNTAWVIFGLSLSLGSSIAAASRT